METIAIMGQKENTTKEAIRKYEVVSECIQYIMNNSINNSDARQILDQLLDACVYNLIAIGADKEETALKLNNISIKMKNSIIKDVMGH